MKLIVGLGNPGEKHSNNRHNIGFLAVNKIVEENNFSNWREKFQGYLSTGIIGSKKIIVLKPMTYMNHSGQSVGELIRFYKIASKDVIVFHDEIELPLARVKVKVGGGHAGHNGLRSVDQHIGSEYTRVRIGVDRPTEKDAVANYVLNNFSNADNEIIETLIEKISNAITHLIEEQNSEFIKTLSNSSKNSDKKYIKPKRNIEGEKTIESISTKGYFLQKLFKKFKNGSDNG